MRRIAPVLFAPVLLTGLLSVSVFADDAATGDHKAAGKKTKFVVDMADSLDFNSFHNDKDAEAVYSTEFALPWKKKDAVNAYQDEGRKDEGRKDEGRKDESKAANRNGGTFVGDAGKPAASRQATLPDSKPVAAAPRHELPVSTEVTAKLTPGTAINIRVVYAIDTEKSSALYSPSTAANELFRQMAAHCQYGFLKMAEWSTPIAGSSDYYLYYQFQCMPAE